MRRAVAASFASFRPFGCALVLLALSASTPPTAAAAAAAEARIDVARSLSGQPSTARGLALQDYLERQILHGDLGFLLFDEESDETKQQKDQAGAGVGSKGIMEGRRRRRIWGRKLLGGEGTTRGRVAQSLSMLAGKTKRRRTTTTAAAAATTTTSKEDSSVIVDSGSHPARSPAIGRQTTTSTTIINTSNGGVNGHDNALVHRLSRLSHHVGSFFHTVALEVASGTAAKLSAKHKALTEAGTAVGVSAGAGSGGEFVPMDPECRRILNTFFMKCAFGPPVETELDHRR